MLEPSPASPPDNKTSKPAQKLLKKRHFKRWRVHLWRWHRRIGINILFFLMIMSISGIALNHSDDLSLHTIRLPYALATTIYGQLDTGDLSKIDAGNQILYQQGKQLTLNTTALAQQCDEKIATLANFEQLIWLPCGKNLLVFTPTGDFVEKVYLSRLASRIALIQPCGSKLCLKSLKTWYSLDPISTKLSPLEAEPQSTGKATSYIAQPLSSQELPKKIRLTPTEYNWGRLISDIHSGAIFGKIGRLFVDIIGIITIFLCLTGAYLWLGSRKTK